MSDMMEENKERKGLERDTTMCGTPQAWFPMRNSREQKVKDELDQLDVNDYAKKDKRV